MLLSGRAYGCEVEGFVFTHLEATDPQDSPQTNQRSHTRADHKTRLKARAEARRYWRAATATVKSGGSLADLVVLPRDNGLLDMRRPLGARSSALAWHSL